jgi:hypothetical protein
MVDPRDSGADLTVPAAPGIVPERSAVPAPQVSVQVYSSLDAPPEPLAAFLTAAGERNFFCGLAWFRTVLRTAGPAADKPRIYAAESRGRVLAVLIVRERQAKPWPKPHLLVSPSRGMDASIFGPLLDPERGMAGLREIVAALARAAPPFHVFRFECLDRQSPECTALVAALHEQKMLVLPFADPYRGYYDDVQGLTIEHYLRQRSPEMRIFIERQVDALARSGRSRFAVITGGPGFKSALVDYALVDLQSWRDPETYPDWLAELLEAAAGAGVLRLGLLYVDDEPAAAQIWIVSAGRATMWRARFARKFAILSVGPVLTFEMIRHALQSEELREIEFGPSDETARREWLGRSRERVGFVVFNLRTFKGWLAGIRHIGGHVANFVLRPLRAARRWVAGARLSRPW